MFYEEVYRIDSRDVDPFNQCRPSALLGLLQEAATKAACALHVSREEMVRQYHVFWMLARIWYRLDRPLRWDEQVRVNTWHRGGKGAAMYRDFDLFVDGIQVGEAVSTWVLADLDTHRLFRLSKVLEFEGTTGEELCKPVTLSKLKLPENMTLAEDRRLHYSDTDINGHVNNVKYADFTCDALHLESAGAGSFVSALQVGYLSECLPGETISLYTGQADGQHFVHGVDAGGKSRFDAALKLRSLPKI